MESNKDEALRSFAIAEKYFNAENLTAARKFCTKSISLFNTPQAEKLLVKINAADANPTASTSSSSGGQSATTSSTSTEEHPSAAGMKHRHHNVPPKAASSNSTSSTASSSASAGEQKKRDYTPEQHAVVKRVRGCKVTEYYEILALKKDCEEADVKKAYRVDLKLALALHPDKNGAPGADEAFKSGYRNVRGLSRTKVADQTSLFFSAPSAVVSKAFQVLSDPQKRAAYDRSGGDPEDRFGGGGGAASSFFNQECWW
ncbi:hypothetical protein NP233_g13075 [Leucocoprinus birnbaumii]|uniref:J domain-containing protein n=1 Tax=Leucocoprinus birnbaumii TaxID=56174 RepID=A0AAD5VDB4_9AGAR|nr:hypothetical protein NP233_g13075 [Leucocoprinus birnbaumii]